MKPGAGEPRVGSPGERLRADLSAGKAARARVMSGSMLPALRPGDYVRVAPAAGVRRGDVVVAETGGLLVIHRVVALDADTVTCRGDRRRRSDPQLPRAAICGRAVEVAGRGPVLGGLRGLVQARLCFWLWAVPTFAVAIGAELALLRLQMSGRTAPVLLTDDGPGPVEGERLRADDAMALLTGGPAAASPLPAAGVSTVWISAGVYGGLEPADRRRLLAALHGREVIVWGRMFDGPRLRATGALRRVLVALGRHAGEPGDSVLLAAAGAWSYLHFFAPADLAEEVRAAGGEVLSTETRVSVAGRFVGVGARL